MNTKDNMKTESAMVLTMNGRAFVAVPLEDFASLLEAAAAAPQRESKPHLLVHWQEFLKQNFEALGELRNEMHIPAARRLRILLEQHSGDVAQSDSEDAEDAVLLDEIHTRLVSGEEEHVPSDIVERLLDDDESPLAVWRNHRGLSQAELAGRAGVSQPMISKIERGENTGSTDTLRRLAGALNVTIEDLLREPH